ncbi:hypothetical protein ACQEVF_25255 [Nonomuraea polychroma]|uniref:hypothetical protein n=1 Tax=Nonomuraea polychroma TaxID=46176 RepID=UPI003D89BEF9
MSVHQYGSLTVVIPATVGQARPGDCTCCSRIKDGRTPGKARYRWEGQNGHIEQLCVRCCALWRQNAAEDVTLAPARVIDLEAT